MPYVNANDPINRNILAAMLGHEKSSLPLVKLNHLISMVRIDPDTVDEACFWLNEMTELPADRAASALKQAQFAHMRMSGLTDNELARLTPSTVSNLLAAQAEVRFLDRTEQRIEQ